MAVPLLVAGRLVGQVSGERVVGDDGRGGRSLVGSGGVVVIT